MESERIHLTVNCTSENCSHFSTCCRLPTEVYTIENSPKTVMFLGMGAGSREEKLKRPFVGPAGERLRQIIKQVWDDKGYFNPIFANTVRCHPKDSNGRDRPPTDEEMGHCGQYIWKDIEETMPNIIIPVGISSSCFLISSFANSSMAKIHGKVKDALSPKSIVFKTIPTYHPSFVIRSHGRGTFSLDNKWDKVVYEDICTALEKA